MPIGEFHAVSSDGSELAERTRQHSRLLSVLLVCAKNIQAFNQSLGLRDQDMAVQCMFDLMVSLSKAYEGDFSRMEAEALALATLLGFNVEQFTLPPSSGVRH